MNSQKYLLITLLVFTSRLLIAQNNTCDFYYSGSITYSSFQTDTSIWYGTESNLVEINLNTKEQTRHFLNKEKTIFSTEGGHFAKDSQGQIWFSLGNKRYVWSGVEWQLSSSSFPGIFGGVVDRTDTIWSISNDSVSRFHNDSAYQPLAVDTSFGYVNLVDIAVDSNNNIWVCGDAISKDMGKYPVPFVASYNHQKWTVYIDSLGSELLQGSVRGITFSKDKGLFLSEGGLYELNNGTFKLTYFTEYLRTINLQNDSTYWIGTYGAGVLVNSGKADTSLFLGNSTLNKNYVDEIAVSEEGIVWAAPGRTNLSRFDGATWESISLVGRNYNRRANGVFCHNGTTYITSYDKLYVNDGLEWKSYDVDLGEGGISMTVDGDGDLFVSSTFRYVYKFDGENFTKYSDFDFSFVNDDYKALATDNDGMVWVAGANKMFYFKDNEWVEFFLPADIKSSSGARKIFFDQNNHLWLAKGANYIFEYDGIHFHKHSPKGFVGTSPRIYATDIALDAEGNLWFASEGIYKYDGESWRLYDSSNSGLFGNYIQAVEPYEGGVWLGTEVGLVDFKNCGDGEPIEFAKEQVSSIDTRSLESQNLHISPNPFSDRISVYSDNAGETILSIYLYDMLGDLQLHWKSSEDDSISKAEVVLSNRMSNGFYLAVISTSDGVFYKKMMRSN